MQPSRHSPRSFAAGRIARGLLCAALGFSVAGAQNPPPEESGEQAEDEKIGFLESDLLPDGSILKGVTLPSYGSGSLRKNSVVRADELVIVNKERINARNLLIEMYNDKGQPDARIAMKKARFLPTKNLLISDEPVSIVSNKLTADGSALVFDTEKTRGFLHGPVKAVTELDLQTSMNSRPARNAFAAGALLMAAVTPLPAQESKEPTSAERLAELRLKPEELEQIAAETASRKQEFAGHDEAAEKSIDLAQHQAEGARITMNDFLRGAALTSLMAEPAPVTEDVPAPDLPDNPLKTTITAKDGAYFDSIAGLAIFLKQVEVKNPEFQLSGADELKVFMDPKATEEDRSQAKAKGSPEDKIPDPSAPEGNKPKPQAPEAKPVVEKAPPTPEMLEEMRAAKEKAKQLGQEKKGDFGSAKRLVATGVVRINYKSAKKTSDGKEQEMIMASARTVIYDIEKEQIILRGGSPWVMKGDQMQRVVGADAYILIYTKDGQPTKIVTGNQELFEGEFATPPKADEKKGQNGPKGQKNPKQEAPKNQNR